MRESNQVGAACGRPQEITQQEYTELVRELLASQYGEAPKAYVRTYGCQANAADGERLQGMLLAMGFCLTAAKEEADLILYNTCAIREHAEDRVFGNVGALKQLKESKRGLKILLCGCMTQQPHIAEKIRTHYSFVDLVLGTHVLHRLPELLYQNLSGGKRIFELPQVEGAIHEDLPVHRESAFKAWLPILHGCDNFCSYCVVPYVRGRERSREPEAVLAEARKLVQQGYKEITLLGQNVNSYGKKLQEEVNFSWLLRELNRMEGDFWIRFMTSHPKDCTPELLDTIAACDKAAKHLHLPVQSGNNGVLRDMNRGYSREQYLSLIEYARRVMPEISITSDIIVGFPGESREAFRDTLELVREAQFTSLFTFIFSPREGTRAAHLPDPVPREEKVRWLQELCALQESIAARRCAGMRGQCFRVLCEEEGRLGDGLVAGRTAGNVIIEFPADVRVIGSFQTVRVTENRNWVLLGELCSGIM